MLNLTQNFTVIAGPCAIESLNGLLQVAAAVKSAGAAVLRGGAFKARTNPRDFDGLKAEGIAYLLEAKQRTGMPVCTEMLSKADAPLFDGVDIIQIGCRNMQNTALLHAAAELGKPIMLKRGFASTVEELLLSAERLTGRGAKQVILCERGIRTFEPSTRFTLDLGAVAVLKQRTDLPVFVDPSHAAGKASLVAPLAMAAVAAGADGLMLEVHHNPKTAKSDAAQALSTAEFEALMQKLPRLRSAVTASGQGSGH